MVLQCFMNLFYLTNLPIKVSERGQFEFSLIHCFGLMS